MKVLLRNCSLPIKGDWFLLKKQGALLCFLLFSFISTAQIANCVSNGGFESLNSNSVSTLYNVADYWQPIDTNQNGYYVVSINSQINPAPNCSYGFQYPRSGNAFVLSTFYSSVSFNPNYREYLRNRLKQVLLAGKTYCVKFFIVNTNNTPLAIDKFGAYFANSSLDTITHCNLPLTFLSPQVGNISGIITDTLNWIPITGTFVATGNEKYMVIGNFYSNSNTNTTVINPAFLPSTTNDVYIDDVSVIELTLPAFAGLDIYGIPTTTVYLGRTQDIGIDEACMWYHLPNNTTAIDTAAGITITVAATTQTYMVKQDICGIIKYDTVVVYASAVGINELLINNEKLKIYPNPSDKNITLELDGVTETEFKLKIFNNLNQLVREEDILIKGNSLLIKTDELNNGVYLLNLKSNKLGTASKRFIIAR